MTEEQLQMLIDSYGLTYLLESLDLEPVAVLERVLEDDESYSTTLESFYE